MAAGSRVGDRAITDQEWHGLCPVCLSNRQRAAFEAWRWVVLAVVACQWFYRQAR